MLNISVMDSVKEKITAKIRGSFVDMIPLDKWDELVQNELELFIDKELPILIKAEMKKQFTQMVLAELDRPEFFENWTPEGQKPSDAVEEISLAS